MNHGQSLKEYLRENPVAHVRIEWEKVSKGVVYSVYDVTEVCEQCFFGRVVEGEPSISKPYWAVLGWSVVKN
jgi:hypothetical protein